MKKLLLSVLTTGAVLGAQAADFTPVWENAVSKVLDEGDYTNAPLTIDSEGNVVATGSFKHDFTLAGASLEAISTSAYIAKYDVRGEAKWAVALTGSASVSAVATDNDGNIYVAGTFADEVTLGSTDGKTATINGMEIWGEPTVEKNSSFIVKYTSDGALLSKVTFIPSDLPELADNPSYFSLDGDIYFHINHLQVFGDKVYASAIYTGHTECDKASFNGSYNDPWGGVYFINLNSAAVFSIDSDLTGAENVVSAEVAAPLATEDDMYQTSAVCFTVTDGTSVYATFSGNGPLQISAGYDKKDLEAAASEYNYIFTKVTNSSLTEVTTAKCPEAGISTTFEPVYSTVYGDTLFVVGYESFAENYGEDNERTGERYFVYTVDPENLTVGSYAAQELTDGNVTFNKVTSAARPGYIVFTALGNYNTSGDGFAKGDFAGVSKTVEFDFGNFSEVSGMDNKCYLAGNTSYLATSASADEGALYELYSNEQAGVGSVTVADSNAPVEYYNLQGVRVANPATGLYIRRQGDAVSKVYVK